MSTGVHQFEDKLLEFAYGELPRHESEAVEAHLRGCTRCAESLAQIRSVRSTMGALPRVAAPDAGLDSLLAYAEQAARRNEAVARPRPWWSRLVLPMASVTAVALVGVFAWRTRDDLQLDPVAVAVGMKKEEAQAARAEYAERQAKNDAAKSEVAPKSPAPAAMPAPAPEPRQLELNKTVAQDSSGDTRLAERPAEAEHLNSTTKREVRSAPPTKVAKVAESTGGLIDDLAQAYGTPADKAPRRESVTRQKDGLKEKKSMASSDDFSNAGRQAAQLNDGASVKQAMEGNALGNTLRGGGGSAVGVGTLGTKGGGTSLDGFGGGLGLGTGTGSGSAGPKPLAKPSPKKSRADVAVSGGEEATAVARAETVSPARPDVTAPPPPQAAAPVTVVANQPAAQPSPPATAAPSEGSLKLGLGRGSLSNGPGADADLARDSETNTDRKMAADEAAFESRVRTEKSQQLAQSARELMARGAHGAAAKQAVAALTAGAQGAARLDALSVACEAFDALGSTDEASPYCSALLLEYPRTAAARQVAERRQRAGEVDTKAGKARSKTAAEQAPTKATLKK